MKTDVPASGRHSRLGTRRAGTCVRHVGLAVLIAVATCWAGADPATDSGAAGTVRTTAAASAPATDLSPAGRELVRDTWPQRIAGSGYYELLDELRRLGLDDRGTRAELEARLRQFHDLPAPAPADGERSRVVEVRRAERAEYATQAETGADSVTLRGAVEVAVLQADPPTVHVIRADEVIYDRTAQLLTARGAVHYEVTQEQGEPQSVRAATMAYDLDSSKAVFLSATTQQQREGATGPLTFSFTAEVITRLSDATIILDDVRFSSSPDPVLTNYEIRARRMWLLAPGEWGLQAATIYVGRVPVFYVPFFFWPGDDVVFHPAVGVRDREGLFLNTTLYLIGRRPREDEPFSVLSLTNPGDYREELRGIFLRKIPGAPPPDDSYLKLMLDLYARLGMFAGAAGMLPVSDVGEVNFQVAAARSRNIYFDSARGTYTIYDPNDRSERLHWNESTLFGTTVPLRYGVELSGDVRFSGGSVRAGMELFSDPEFPSDFGNRQERFDWPTLIGFPGAPDTPPVRRSNLTWEVVARADLSALVGVDRPRSVEQLRLTNAGVYWLWRSRADPAVALIDPTRSFYYPATLRVQSAAQMGGTLLQLPATRVPASEPRMASVPGRGLRAFDTEPDPEQGGPPASGDEPASRTARTVPFRLPEPRATDIRAPPVEPPASMPAPAEARAGYDLSPGVTVEAIYGSDDWKTATDVDHAMESITLRVDHTTRLDRGVDLYGGLLSFDNGLRHSLTVLHPQRGEALTDDDWEHLRRASLQRSGTSVHLDNRITLRPLRGVPAWENSAIVYDLDLRLLNVVYDEPRGGHRSEWGVWDEDGVVTHRLETVAAWQLGEFPQRLTLTGDLPPRPAFLSARLDLDGGLASATAALEARCRSGTESLGECHELKPEPLSITARVTPLEWLSLSERVTIDLIRSQFERTESTLRAGGLGASLIARRAEPDDPLQVRQLRLDYADTFGPNHLWRNRVAVQFEPRANWTVDVIEPERSRLTFTTSLTLGIHEFLDLRFGTASSNDNTYCYVPAWADAACSTRNPLEDLFWSLAFWNENQRRQSNFKADRISVSAVHHLQDWDLTFEFEARPMPREDGFSEFQSRFSLFLQWLPVPEIRSNVGGDGDSFFIDETGE